MQNISNCMVIESRGIMIDQYFIPPFEVRRAELIVICLFSGAHFNDVERQVIDILTGKVQHEQVTLYQPLTYVPHFREPRYRKLFYPVTVGEYLKKYARGQSVFAGEIYRQTFIKKNTKIKTLENKYQRLLSLYTTLSHTDAIIFDLIGLSTEGAQEIYSVVKTHIKQGGTAILLDNFTDMQHDCVTYVELEMSNA